MFSLLFHVDFSVADICCQHQNHRRNSDMHPEYGKLTRRSFLRMAGGATGLVALAACAPVAAPAGEGGAAPAEAKSLSVWAHRSFAPPADDILLANIDKWGKDNGVELEVVAEIEVPTMNDRLMAAVESKVLPDVSAVSGGRVPLHYPAGVYLDVSDLYKEFADQYGGFFRAGEETVTIDGKQWAIPYSIDSSLMYYRKDILDEKGLSIPDTWENYAETMKAAQTPPDIYGVGLALNKAATDCNGTFTNMLYSYGATLVAEDGQTITVNSDETRAWLNFVVEGMYNQDLFPPDAFEWDNAANNAAYQDETAISINNPASVLVWMLDNKPELAQVTAIEALPAGPAGSFNSAGTRVAWALFNTSPADKQELGKDLLRYLMEPAQFEPWIAKAFAAPAVVQYETMEIWSDPQRAGFLDAAKNGVLGGYPGPLTVAYSELDTFVPCTSMVLRVIVDGWTVDEAIEEAEQVAKEIYAKYYPA
jgi:ABC-type glycerol-3-phosphate transport system substrate-binding protein